MARPGDSRTSRSERRRQARTGRREAPRDRSTDVTQDAIDQSGIVSFLTQVIALASRPRVATTVGLAILVAFAVYLALQLRMVFPYYDDWGMAALDFHQITVEGARGRDSGLAQVIDYLSQFYMRWGGRVFAFFLQIYVFKIAGADGARLVQWFATLMMVLLCARLAAPTRWLGWAVAIPVVLYLAVPLHMVARGAYWFSASSHSLWSVPFLLGGALVCLRRGAITPYAAALFAASALFNEMLAAAALVVIGVQVLSAFLTSWPRRLPVHQLLLCIPAVASAGFVVLAPGNFARARTFEYPSANRLDNVIVNLGRIESLLLASPLSSALLLIWMLSAVALLCLIGIQSSWLRSALCAAAGAAVLFGGSMISGPALLTGALLSYAGLIAVLHRKHGAIMMLGIYGGAVATLVPLLASPEVYPRSLMTFCFLLFAPIAWSLARLAGSGTRWTLAVAGAILVCLVPSFANARAIFRGYSASYPLHLANEQSLERVARQVSDGSYDGTPIPYYMLPSVRFAELMPYQREFIEVWIKKYYSLPLDVKFEYLPPQRLGDSSGREP